VTDRGVMSTVQRVGHAVWTERRLFEALGGWVRSTDDPATKVALATQSRHHAWRADQLASLLSTFGGTDAQQLTTPVDGAVAAALVACADAPTATRLATVADLTAALVAEYEALRDEATEASGAPARRMIGIVVEDLRRDRQVLDGVLSVE
jgi:hypothetical protein